MSKEVLLQNLNDKNYNVVLSEYGNDIIAEYRDGTVLKWEDSSLNKILDLFIPDDTVSEYEIVSNFSTK